jgi:rod shape determining protein RodA
MTDLFIPKPLGGLGNVRKSPSEPMRNVDWVLMLATAALAFVGFFAIYSASKPRLDRIGEDPYAYVTRQVIFVIIGAVVMAAVMSVDYALIKQKASVLYIGTIMSHLGPILLQPSEFAKVTVLMLIAGYLGDDETGGQLSYARFINGLLLVGVPVGLILLQPDFGTASVLIALAMGVLLVAGASMRYILFISILTVASIGALIAGNFVRDYQVDRLTAFVKQNVPDNDPSKDLVQQVKNSKRAVATGGVVGKGYLKGDITNGRYIPIQWTDFVFSAIAEQFGLVGTITLLMLYFFVLFRIWRIARLARDDVGLYICAGAMTMIVWHVFENIGMTMGIMPVTGIPLPLISYGGSSAIAFMAMIGLVQNVHMRRMR